MLCETAGEQDIPKLQATGKFIGQEKLDGTRATISKGLILNRHGRDIGLRYPELLKLKLPDIALDGEIITTDKVFNHLQIREAQRNPFNIKLVMKQFPAVFIAFDITRVGQQDTTQLRLTERLKMLEALRKMIEQEHLRVITTREDLVELYEQIKAEGGEGIVVKYKDSTYEDKRSQNWIKIKTHKEQDLKVVGYTSEKREVSALLLEGGKKVNFGVPNNIYEYWKPKIIAGENITAVVEYHKDTEQGKLRFAILKELRNN